MAIDVMEEIRKAGTRRLTLEHRHGLVFDESVDHNLDTLKRFLAMCRLCPEDGAGSLFDADGNHFANVKPITDLRGLAEEITARVCALPEGAKG